MNTTLRKPIAIVSAMLLAIFIAVPALAVAPAPGAFERTWERTDKPVADGVLARTWIWGPEANTPVLEEPYLESPGGVRDVQYFDKSRMEINDPNAVDDGLWYVTNGLLVVELMSGMMQVGDDSFIQRSPADINIVGDPGYAETPTYADYADLQDSPAFAEGAVLTATIDGDGNIGNDPALASWNVTASELAPLTGHRTASVFWEFMNSQTTVYENGQFVTDDLFLNPYYATGYPITEAYWSQVMLAGSEQWVLTQAFERRVLTYAPNNNEGFQVEAGNVGLHYYQWRYELEPGTINVTTFEFDGTTEQGSVLVEAYLIAAGEDCDDVNFGTDEPTAFATTGAATGTASFSDLEPGRYCLGADFDGDDIANDDTAVVNLAAGATVAVSLVNPDDQVVNMIAVTVLDDMDETVSGATVEVFAGACATVDNDDDAVATGTTNASGVANVNVDGLDEGAYCVIATSNGTTFGEADVTLPDDTSVTVGGMVGVVVTTSTGVNEVQTLTASGATSGMFTLTFAGQETIALPFNATAGQIEAALIALSNIGPNDINVTGGPIHTTDVVVTFTGDLGYTNVSELVVDNSNLDGVSVAITMTTTGVAPVNEVQTISSHDAIGGTFTLTFGDETTTGIAWNASSMIIQAALLGLGNTTPGDISVSGGPIDDNAVIVTFQDDLGGTNVSLITVDTTGLTDYSDGLDVTETTQGVAAVNAVQTIAATGATSGTFTLTFDGDTTGALPWNATADQILAALILATDLEVGDVTAVGGPVNLNDVVVTFTGNFAATDVDLMTANDSNLFGAAITVQTTTQGAPPTVQQIYVGSAVTGGTFTLTYDGDETAPIDFDATASEIQSALNALDSIIAVNVVGDLGPGESATVTFINPPAEALLVVDDTDIE